MGRKPLSAAVKRERNAARQRRWRKKQKAVRQQSKSPGTLDPVLSLTTLNHDIGPSSTVAMLTIFLGGHLSFKWVKKVAGSITVPRQKSERSSLHTP